MKLYVRNINNCGFGKYRHSILFLIIDLQEEYKRRGLAETDLDNHMDLEPDDFFDRTSQKSLTVPLAGGALWHATCAIL